jgi:hypothetical protein
MSTEPEATRRPVALTLLAAGAVMAMNSALFGSRLMLDSRPFPEVAATDSQVVYHAVLLAVLVALIQTLPHLGALSGRDGRTFPRVLLVLVGIGMTLDAGTRVVEGFMVPSLADDAPHLLEAAPAPLLLTLMVSGWVVYALGLFALGAVAFARRIFPRPAAALVAVGALVIPVVGPFSGLVIGTGLAWAGLAAIRHRRASVAGVVVPVAG